MKLVVDHTAGSRRGQRQELDVSERIRFGRHPVNEVTFDAHRDLDASSRHAELVRQGSRFVLRDVGSSNGLFVDGERVIETDVPVGRPIEVAFGRTGPRVRLYIGDPSDLSAPEIGAPIAAAPTPARGPAGVVRAAAAAARAGGRFRIAAFVPALARELVYGSSRGVKVGVSLALTVAVVAAGAAWLARTAPAPQGARPPAAAEPSPAPAGPPAGEAARGEAVARAARGLYALVATGAGGTPAQPPDAPACPARACVIEGMFCAAFAVEARTVATAAECAAAAAAARRAGLSIRAVAAATGEPAPVGPWRSVGAISLATLGRSAVGTVSLASRDGPRVGDNLVCLVPSADRAGGTDARGVRAIASVALGTREGDGSMIRHTAGDCAPGAPLVDVRGRAAGVATSAPREAGVNYAASTGALRGDLRENGGAVRARGIRDDG
ncbi:MAG: FHA domain-containing protein [Deltaproteobacteria bacterium]|nr:MAG: FHA domain-containing protein [Deltaproteobacteria bacterium]